MATVWLTIAYGVKKFIQCSGIIQSLNELHFCGAIFDANTAAINLVYARGQRQNV